VGSGEFTIKITNTDTENVSFESNPLYPYKVTSPNTCAWTGGITCELLGNPQCANAHRLLVEIDPNNTVREEDENNNTTKANI